MDAQKPKKRINIPGQFLILALGWSVITLVAMGYDMWNTWQRSLDAGRLQAKIALQKDLHYRQWNASLGGVYGEVGDNLQPNPYLQDIKERDLVTPSGRKLTLINPASMTRQVNELGRKKGEVYGHITSLDPLNPHNAPDDWEREALLGFTRGDRSATTFEEREGMQFVRMMVPLVVDSSCLGCHGEHGYKEGDLRGGLSVRVSMQELMELYRSHMLTVYLLYLAVWLVGLAGLGWGARRLKIQFDHRESVEKSLADFKATLDSIDESVIMFDADSLVFFYCNRGARKLTGYDREQLLEMDLTGLIEGDQLESFTSLLGPLFRGQRQSWMLETIIKRADDSRVPVEMHLSYVVPNEGKARFLVVVRDISERKKAEKEKETIQSRLLQAQKLESVGQLAAGVAHELNTPVQFIRGNMDFLRESFADSVALVDASQSLAQQCLATEPPHEAAEKILQQMQEIDWEYLREEIPSAVDQSIEGLERMRSIVSAMKDFANPASKEMAAENINRLVETTLTVSANEWKYVAELQTELASDLPVVPCLRDELGQVLLNLIVNAAQAIGDRLEREASKEKGRITITTRTRNGYVEILVADDGGGIPEKIAHRIFDPFFTTKEVGKGKGQGLAICRDVIAKQHGGELDFTTESGVGTTFIVRLPLRK